MRSEIDAFLMAIMEKPDDTNTMLVFADWLDEHGMPQQAAYLRSSEGQRTISYLLTVGGKWGPLLRESLTIELIPPDMHLDHFRIWREHIDVKAHRQNSVPFLHNSTT